MASAGMMMQAPGATMCPEMSPDWLYAKEMTGTTIMAVEYDGGVVIGADSRTSSGSFVVNRISDKLTRVTDNIYCCRTGVTADTQAIADIVNYHLSFHKMQLGEEALVKSAASVFQDLAYSYRDGLSAAFIVAGWDKRQGGQVFSIPLGGMCSRIPFATGGSGSTYIYGFVDSNYKTGMTKEECFKFVTTAVALAMNRDRGSGGIIRLASLSEEGIERRTILHDDLPTFFQA